MGNLKELLSEADDYKPARHPCRTCKKPEVVHQAIKMVADRVLAGDSRASFSWLHRKLQQKFKYDLCLGALRSHMIRCEPELWEAWARA